MTPPISSCLHSFFILLSVARRCTAAGTHGIVAQLEERTAGTAADGRCRVRFPPMPPPSFFRFFGRGPPFFTAYPSAVYDGTMPDCVSYPTIRGGRSHLPSGKSRPVRAAGNSANREQTLLPKLKRFGVIAHSKCDLDGSCHSKGREVRRRNVRTQMLTKGDTGATSGLLWEYAGKCSKVAMRSPKPRVVGSIPNCPCQKRCGITVGKWHSVPPESAPEH